MRKVIIFPGQGYQNIQMLTSEVQDFCYKHNIGDLLNSVLEDNSKVFDTQYAQALIVATQLVQLNKYKLSQSPDTEYVYCGFSLGEITALIASGAIDISEGLEFARQRGNLCKNFSQNQLQNGVSPTEPKRTFSVAKIAYYDGLKNDILAFNSTHLDYEKISITNYIPTDAVPSKIYVTITSESNTLKNNLELFKGSSSQKTATMQCPFHSEALIDLIPAQVNSFNSCVTDIDSSCLPYVICTRTASKYDSIDTKNDINKSLAKYLVHPIQTEKTLLHIKEHYPEDEILVTMGKSFAEGLAQQYGTIGGKQDNVSFIGDKTPIPQHQSLNEVAK